MVVALSEWFLGLVAWFFLVVVVAWWIRVVAVVGGMDSRPRHQMMCLLWPPIWTTQGMVGW